MSASPTRWDDDLPESWEDTTDSPPRAECDEVVLDEVDDVFVLRLRLADPPEGVRPSECLLVSTLAVDVDP